MKVLIQKIAEKRVNPSIKVGYWVYGEGGEIEFGLCYSALRLINSDGKDVLGWFTTSPIIAIRNISEKEIEIETQNSTYLITELTQTEDYRPYIKSLNS